MNKNDHIDVSFYQDSEYEVPPNVAVYHDRSSSRNTNPHVAVPFWVAIETLTLGEILRVLHYLQDDVMEDVLKDFNLPLAKRFQFLNMIDILLCLRNSCAHTTLINRFRTKKKVRIDALLISSFNLSPVNHDSILKLYDVIKILSYFTDVSALKKPFFNLKIKDYFSLGIIQGKETYNITLDRMGCENNKKWKELFKNPNYFL